MLRSEFAARTLYCPDDEEYRFIETSYIESPLNMDDFASSGKVTMTPADGRQSLHYGKPSANGRQNVASWRSNSRRSRSNSNFTSLTTSAR